MQNKTWTFALALALAAAPISSLLAAGGAAGGGAAGSGTDIVIERFCLFLRLGKACHNDPWEFR
jgi:hypothetical protein